MRSHDLKFRPVSSGLIGQLCGLALKTPITTVRYGFLLKTN